METFFLVAIRPKETYTVKSTIHMQWLVPHLSGTASGALKQNISRYWYDISKKKGHSSLQHILSSFLFNWE